MLFALVLVSGFRVDVADAESDEGIVFLEELRQIEVFAAVVGLLVEIHCADTNLRTFEVRRYIDDEVVGPHVAEEANEAAFIELDQLFRDPDCFELLVFHPVLDKHIPRQANEVLFNEGIVVANEVHAIGRQQVLELQSVNSRGIRFFDVEVILIVVAGIDDPDSERLGVSECAIIDAIHVEMMDNREVAARFDNGIDLFQALGKLGDHDVIVDDGLPKRILVIVVVKRSGGLELLEFLIGDWQALLAIEAL